MEAGPSVMYSVCSQDLTLPMNFVIIEKPVCYSRLLFQSLNVSFHNDIHSTDFHTLHNMVDYKTKNLP